MNISDKAPVNAADTETRANLLRRGLNLEYVTLCWNVVGVLVVGVAALRSNSVALAGFGLDSLIEIFASLVVIWHLTGSRGHNEKLALRLIGAAFLALAAYVIGQTGYVLTEGVRPAPSVFGIVRLAVTVIAMLLLAWGKGATGRKLENSVLIAESRDHRDRRLSGCGCTDRRRLEHRRWMVVGRPALWTGHRLLRNDGRNSPLARG